MKAMRKRHDYRSSYKGKTDAELKKSLLFWEDEYYKYIECPFSNHRVNKALKHISYLENRLNK